MSCSSLIFILFLLSSVFSSAKFTCVVTSLNGCSYPEKSSVISKSLTFHLYSLKKYLSSSQKGIQKHQDRLLEKKVSSNNSVPVPTPEKFMHASLGGNRPISATAYSWEICAAAAAPGVVHSSFQSLQITGNATLRETQKGYIILGVWLEKNLGL